MRQGNRFALALFAGAVALMAGLSGPVQAQVTVGPFISPQSFYVLPQNTRVVLSWAAIPNPALVGYNVYRRAAGETADKNVLMNATPLVITSAVDMGADGKGLKNGTSFIYSVKAVYTGSDGKAVEGPATREIVATPQVPIKNLFTLYDIQTLNPGSAVLDASNVLTIQASGGELWAANDMHSFLAVPVSGDFQVTVKLNERPTKITAGTSNSAKVGLEIKADLQVGAPYAAFFASVDRSPNEFLFEGRKAPVNGPTFSQGPGIASADAKFPVWLRLVRRGDVISAFIATDAAGANFQQVGDDQDFSSSAPLPSIVYVGIIATALSDGNVVQGKLDFNTLKIENAP
jgi:hypothetical protein